MENTHTFQAKVDEAGKLAFKRSDLLTRFLRHHVAGRNVRVTITDQKPKRSTQQNNLYWLYLDLIEQETGNFADDLHILFKDKYLSKRRINVLGETVVKQPGTAELTKSEFAEYLMKIETDTEIPIPDTEGFLYGSEEDYQKRVRLLQEEAEIN